MKMITWAFVADWAEWLTFASMISMLLFIVIESVARGEAGKAAFFSPFFALGAIAVIFNYAEKWGWV